MTPDQFARVAQAWWGGMQPSLSAGTRNPQADRGALARLRRADLAGAMAEPAAFALLRALGGGETLFSRAALCAAVLASVREDDASRHPARTLGPPSRDAPEQAAMKPIRFRRLIEATDDEDRLTLLRRAVAIADKRRVNVREIAAACLDWSDIRRRHWLFEYHNAAAASPEAGSAQEDAAP